ncbi:MAG TPA: glycosyltransferase [Candidatus Methylacidiphilales bacterium]|jgi:hypothetical protein|nr:glycosyltransferase [Candidatus Methylacidiphilales bacterium]
MRLLYLHPEEWTGRRARETHALSTCAALAQSGVDVTLVAAGGERQLLDHLLDVAGAHDVSGLHLVALPHTLGPLQSTSIFARNFAHWMRNRLPFDLAFTSDLKAALILIQAGIPYAYEAHEIAAQAPQNAARQRMLHKLEAQVLAAAAQNIATSAPLAVALNTWFSLSRDFAIVPNAGLPPLDKGIGVPDGPFVYCGSIAEGNDLAGVIQAARDTRLPLKIVGGTGEEWRMLGEQLDTAGVEWRPRAPLTELPESLAGARAGLIPTNPDAPSGEFSCPMKLFDYARCGLPVISTALPALQSLDVGPWCAQIPSPARAAWMEALRQFCHEADHAEAARAWSGEHTWAKRAELLKRAFGM